MCVDLLHEIISWINLDGNKNGQFSCLSPLHECDGHDCDCSLLYGEKNPQFSLIWAPMDDVIRLNETSPQPTPPLIFIGGQILRNLA